jgi:hypothetical protein
LSEEASQKFEQASERLAEISRWFSKIADWFGGTPILLATAAPESQLEGELSAPAR